MKKRLLLLLIAVIGIPFAFQTRVEAKSTFCQQIEGAKLVSDEDDPQYLGTISSDKYNSESIAYQYGDYGSKYGSKSILYKYGDYGSKYGSLSPWYQYSSTPPRIVDADFNVLGYITRNKYLTGAVHPLLALSCIIDLDDERLEPYWEISKDDDLGSSSVSAAATPKYEPAGPFVDVPWESDGNADIFIGRLKELGILGGYPDGTFKPEKIINRAELLKIVINSRFGEEVSPIDKYCFPDVEGSSWYAKYACFAKEQGIVAGYDDGNFKPGQEIRYAEALKIALRTYGHRITEGDPWYQAYLDYFSEGNRKLMITATQELNIDALDLLSRKNMALLIFDVWGSRNLGNRTE